MGIGRDVLLRPVKRTFHEVETSRGVVRLRSVTERERAKFEADTLDKSGKVTKRGLVSMKPRLIILCAVDDQGDPILNQGDIDSLLDMDSQTINNWRMSASSWWASRRAMLRTWKKTTKRPPETIRTKVGADSGGH